MTELSAPVTLASIKEVVEEVVKKVVKEAVTEAIQRDVPPIVRAIIREEVPPMVRAIIKEEVPPMIRMIIKEEVPPMVRSIIKEEVPPMVRAIVKEELFVYTEEVLMPHFETVYKEIKDTKKELKETIVSEVAKLRVYIDKKTDQTDGRVTILERKVRKLEVA